MVPDADTELGVIAPSVKDMAGVVVELATVPETPLADVTDTLVTVPAVLCGCNRSQAEPVQ